MNHISVEKYVGRGLYRKWKIVCGAMAICFGLLPIPVQAYWEKPGQPPAIEAPADFFMDPAGRIVAAAGHEVFVLEKGSWTKAAALSEIGSGILRIYPSPAGDICFALTSRSIWRIQAGSPAVKIYSGQADSAPLSFAAASDENYFTGTAKGLFESRDSGKTWTLSRSARAGEPVVFIYPVKAGIFVGQSEAVWFAGSHTIRKVFSFFSSSSEPGESEDEDTVSEEDVPAGKTLLTDFSENDSGYFLSTARGVFFSEDGLEWISLPSSGLARETYVRMAAAPAGESALLASDKTVYLYDNFSKIWRPLSGGMTRGKITSAGWIRHQGEYIPAAAGQDGILIWKNISADVSPASEDRAQLFNRLVDLEPSARDIQKHVIRYADVSNGKIKRWHAESRLAALLPDISLGKDLYRANNLDIDRGGTADADQFIEGPAERHRSFSADVSWDLGDMLFSTSQASIDSREKLMVELRNDLLAEAMRLYFERRRLQAEIVRGGDADEALHMDKMLRLEELTSLLDALTNGYLSRRLEKIYQENPDLEEIWRFRRNKAQ